MNASQLSPRECIRRLTALHEQHWYWGMERLIGELTGDERRWREATTRQRAIWLTAEPLRRLLAEASEKNA